MRHSELENFKKSRPKKLVKSNISISWKKFLTKIHFCYFKNGQKSIFELGKCLKTAKNGISQVSRRPALNWLTSDIGSIIYMIQVNKHFSKQSHLRYFTVRNEQLVTSCSVLWLCFVLISVDVEKCQHNKVSTRFTSISATRAHF